jgi:hypothetical protein
MNRRQWLHAGALSSLGLTLPGLLRAEGARKPPARAKSCVLFLLQGGPSQLDIWDMKPEAPAEVRGFFKPAASRVPGMQICEHLPRLAQVSHLYSIVRSMAHKMVFHNAATTYALSGNPPLRDATQLSPSENDFPHLGAQIAYRRPAQGLVPTWVALPNAIGEGNFTIPSQNAGFLGASYGPFAISGDPGTPGFYVQGLGAGPECQFERLAQRRALLAKLDRGPMPRDERALSELDTYQQRALTLLTSTATREAFELERESVQLRDRYGRHKYGQSLLLTRRLLEAGVRLVTVYWGGRINNPLPYWDTHDQLFDRLKDELLPPFDQCLAAFLEDLQQRGLLQDTLVVCLGEFGRTPRIGQFTGNGADPTGRDHWPHCYSLLVAGGTPGGRVLGKSDRFAAYPADDPYTPQDLGATILHHMGVQPTDQVRDGFNRMVPLSMGRLRPALFGE